MAARHPQQEFPSSPAHVIAGEIPFVRTGASLAFPPANPQRSLKILWIADIDYRLGSAHGGNLRLINFARELGKQGHETFFAVPQRKTDDDTEKRAFLDGLKEKGIITNHFSIEYRHPKVTGKLAHLTFYPAAANRLLRSAQEPLVDHIKRIIAANAIDVCVFMSRDLLFALPELNTQTTTVIDWVDSYALYHLREARLHLKAARPAKLLRSLQLAAEAFILERYYSRRAELNLAVSSVDQSYINRNSNSHVVANGVATSTQTLPAKVKGQLIFTGNMDFPPNYQSALWFIDEVFPLLKHRADVRLVIAGANPVSELMSRAGDRIDVTGYVENLSREIAQSDLYVAPLVCGSGFKNKVVEAIANGTYVVGTSMAVEFLGLQIRERLLVADSPRAIAGAILDYLDDPSAFASRLAEARDIIAEKLTWEAQASEFLRLLNTQNRNETLQN
jgi:glycosyltransferase involved in cell wall biosynthesis